MHHGNEEAGAGLVEPWTRSVSRGSFTTAEITNHLAKLDPDHRSILDILMNGLLRRASHLEYKWVKWGKGDSLPGIHAKVPGVSKPFVVVAIIPMIRRGVVVRSRRFIDGFERGSDPQLGFEQVIENEEQIEQVITHCASAR